MSKEYVVKTVSIENIEPDPVNQEAFNIKDIEELAGYIKEEGFFGDVTAYPIDNGKYRLESGERRYWAAIKAGLSEIPVNITDPPESEIERRNRLQRRNLGNRKMSPMDMAKLVSFEYETNSLRKKNGITDESLIDLTAKRLHISTSQVSKYKMLNDLVPELQDMVDSKAVPWAIMAQASQLPEENQKALAERIKREMKISEVTGTWLLKEIRDFRHIKLNGYVSNRPAPASIPEPEMPKRFRRKDGYKAVKNAHTYLKSCMEDDYIIKKEDMEETKTLIKEMEDMISRIKASMRS